METCCGRLLKLLYVSIWRERRGSSEAREKERKGMREGKYVLPAVLRASSGKKTFAVDPDDTLDKTQETDSR